MHYMFKILNVHHHEGFVHSYIQRECTFVYKAQNSLGPQYLSDMFTPVSEVHGMNIRSPANCDL